MEEEKKKLSYRAMGRRTKKYRKGKCFANVKKKLAEGKGTNHSCKTKTNSNEPFTSAHSRGKSFARSR